MRFEEGDVVFVEPRRALLKLFEKMLTEITGQQFEVHALDASCFKKRKFSMHLHATLQMQSHYVDAAIVGYALNASINLWIWKDAQADCPSRLSVLGAAFLWNWEEHTPRCEHTYRKSLAEIRDQRVLGWGQGSGLEVQSGKVRVWFFNITSPGHEHFVALPRDRTICKLDVGPGGVLKEKYIAFEGLKVAVPKLDLKGNYSRS